MANRYWVGGTAAWDGTAGTKWALTSGGAGGQAVPTSADDVFFDATSGAVTCTISTGNTGAKSINCTGFTGTLAGTAAISVSGSVTLVVGMTYTYTGVLSIIATGTIISAAKTFGDVTINGTGITTTLGDALTLGIANTFTLTTGTLALNEFTLSTGIFNASGTSTRAVTFGSANIALTSTTNGTTILAMATATGFTYTGTGGITRVQATTATMQFGSTAGATSTNALNLTVTSGAQTLTLTTGSSFKNITLTGSTCIVTGFTTTAYGNVIIASGGTYTNFGIIFKTSQTFSSLGKALDDITVDGAGITLALGDALTHEDFTLTNGTLDLNGFTLSSDTFTSSNSNTRSIAFGSANIVLKSTTAATTVLSMATATNFTYTGTGGFTRNMAATATMVFGTTAGSASNAPNLTVNAGASALTITATSHFKSINFTGSTSTVTGTVITYGNLTLASGGTYTGLIPTFAATATVNSLGKVLGSTTVSGAAITVTLGDNLTVDPASIFTLTQGAIVFNNFTLSAGRFVSSNTNTRSIALGSGNIVLTSTTAAATVLNMADARNFTSTGTGGFIRNQAATATISFGSTLGAASTNILPLTVNAGASALTITATSSFKAVNFTGSTCSVTGIVYVNGNLTLATGGTYTGLGIGLLATQTFFSLGKTVSYLDFVEPGVTITLGDALTATGACFLNAGTLDLNGFPLSVGQFASDGSLTRAIAFGSQNITLTITTAAAVVLDMIDLTNFTYTGTGGFVRNQAATATMRVGNSAGGSVTNAPNLSVNAGVNGLTITADSWFNNFDFTGTTCSITSTNVNITGDITIPAGVNVGPCSITFRDSGTATTNIKSFANITVNAPGGVITCADGLSANTALTLVAGTLKLKSGATSDFGSIVTTGTTLKYLESSTPGVQATITDPTGTNTVTYLSIKDSNATGGAIFTATSPTNIDAGNNTGWIFVVGGGGNFFLLF